MAQTAAEAPHRTRELLLEAGAEVAASEGLAGLSVNHVVAAAVAVATRDTEPGAEQIWRGAEAYLDVCLEYPAIKALALEARTEGALTSSMDDRHDRATAAAVPGFRAMGWPDARAASQLLSAMTAEIAIRELDAGRRLPAARRSLRRFLGVDDARASGKGKGRR